MDSIFGRSNSFILRNVLCQNMAKRGDSPPPYGIHFRSDGSVSASAGFDANDISPYTLQILQAMSSLGILSRCSESPESPDVFVGGSGQGQLVAKEQEKGKKADASSASASDGRTAEKGSENSEKKSNKGGDRKKPKAKAQKKKNHKKK